jgi:hypothetical protein
VVSTGWVAVGVVQGTGVVGSSVRARRGGRLLGRRLPGLSAAGIAGPPLVLIIPVCPGEGRFVTAPAAGEGVAAEQYGHRLWTIRARCRGGPGSLR